MAFTFMIEVQETGQPIFLTQREYLGVEIQALKATDGAGVVYLTANGMFTPLGVYATRERVQEVADKPIADRVNNLQIVNENHGRFIACAGRARSRSSSSIF